MSVSAPVAAPVAVTGEVPAESYTQAGRWLGAAFMLPALAAVAVRLVTGPQPIDDAFITFRYARNLADGLGLVYNPGEWVLGTTAPLWAILLAAGYRLGFTDLPWLAEVLSALCDALACALLVGFSLRIGWRPLGAALVGLAWAFNPMSIAFATGGMETSLFVLVALVVLGLAARRTHLGLAAALAGCATLIRPEGVLLALTVVGWTWLISRRQTWHVIVASATPIASAGLALLWRYGSPLPNSVAAKQVAYQPVEPFINPLALLLQAGQPGWSAFMLDALPGTVDVLLALFGLLVLVELTRRGLPWLEARGVPWQPFAAFAALYFSFYVVVGLRGVRLFNWYMLPLEPFYLLAAAAGLARLGGIRMSWLAAVLLVWQLPAIDWHQPFLPAGETLVREHLLLDVGRDLRASLPSTALVAAPEIGAVGYASNLRVLDTVGLVSPAAVAYYPLPADQLVTDNAIPARLIDDRQPDVVVALDAYAQRTLLVDPTFLSEYRLERSYPAEVWMSSRLLVFRRTPRE